MNSRDALLGLVDDAVSGQITPEKLAELNNRLRSDRGARLLYLRYCRLHTELHFAFRARRVQEALARQIGLPGWDGSRSRTARFLPHWRSALAAACVAAAAALLVWIVSTWPAQSTAPAEPVAVLSMASACQWDGTSPAEGDSLRPGLLSLQSGLAEITFPTGAVVLLEGPARLELTGTSRAFLQAGNVLARVPAAAAGFTIETPRTNVVDLGTEFSVSVDAGRVTDIQVYRGAVVAHLKNVAGESGSRRVAAGQAVQLSDGDAARFRETTFTPERFVRTLPEARADKTPYNRIRYDTLHVVPAPENVVIDGDLKDWDLSGRFVTRCAQPYGRHYYVEGAMMYDERFLYIGAHVGDPAPMRNVIGPAPNALPWKGGALQVRVSTDPKLGWPLKGESEHKDPKDRLPDDVSPGLTHLTMWYLRPQQAAQLHVAHGLDYHDERWNPAGFRGAFRPDADGRGYTLEYAFPWSMLNSAGPPPTEVPLAASWVLHWSDTGGRDWRGQLVDVLNPAANDWHTYSRGSTWGKAIYHRRGNLPPGTVRPLD